MLPQSCQEPLHLCRAQVRPSWLRKAKGKLPGGEQPISCHVRMMGEPTGGPRSLGNCLKNTGPRGTSHLPSAAAHELMVIALPKTFYSILLLLFTLSPHAKTLQQTEPPGCATYKAGGNHSVNCSFNIKPSPWHDQGTVGICIYF